MTIPQTPHTPLVVADFDQGKITVQGKIIPENPDEFFNQLEILTDLSFKKNTQPVLNIDFQLDYFNTTSSKMLARYLKSIIREGLKINWTYEKGDDSIREAGEDYATLLEFPFNIIEVEN